MAREQDTTDWGWALPALLVLGGIWWWNRGDTPPPPPPIITPAASAPAPVLQPAPAVPTPAPTLSAPTANYAFVEGDAYGYIAAISEEDRKQGKAAGDVVMYRYAGFWDDEFHLERVSDSGAIMSVSTCTRPCAAIKTYAGGTMDRVAFNPLSIVGSAMEDAMAGRLKRKKVVRTERQPVSEPEAEATSAAAPTRDDAPEIEQIPPATSPQSEPVEEE